MKEILTVHRIELFPPTHATVDLRADAINGPAEVTLWMHIPALETFGIKIGARFVVTLEATDLTTIR